MSNDDSTPTPGEIDGLVDEVLRLDGEATPGPWDKRWNLWSGEGVTVYAENDRTGDGPIIYGSGMDAQANCELTAEYRTAAPALARALQAERAEVQHLRAVLDAAPHGPGCASTRHAPPGSNCRCCACTCWKASALSKGGTAP